jgi:hypothetical protein
MNQKTECDHCEEYRKQGHNYCRICGFHLTKGYAKNAQLAAGYYSNEKFCGYCGALRAACECIFR